MHDLGSTSSPFWGCGVKLSFLLCILVGFIGGFSGLVFFALFRV